jgi:DNA-binding PadR family transcriptional regulator
MNALLEDVIKLMARDTITMAEMMHRLNRNGWDVRPADVLDALHRLEAQRVLERLWRRKQEDAKPNVAVKKAASVGH